MTLEIIRRLREIENQLDYGHSHWFTNNNFVYFDNIGDLEEYAFSHGMMNCLEYAVSCKKILGRCSKSTKTRIFEFLCAYGMFGQHFACNAEVHSSGIYLEHPNLLSRKESDAELELEEALKRLKETKLQLENSTFKSSLTVYGERIAGDFLAGSIFFGNEDPEHDEYGIYLGDVVIERYRSKSGILLDIKKGKKGNVKYVELLDKMIPVFTLISEPIPSTFLNGRCASINESEEVNSSGDLKKLIKKYLKLEITEQTEKYIALFSMLDEEYMKVRRNQVFDELNRRKNN